MRRSSPTVFPCCENCVKIWGGVSFPSTNSKSKRIPVSPQQMVWYSFPKGCGFRGQNTQPGHVHLEVQMDIDSSRQTIHDMNTAAMLSLQALIISRTSQNLSRNAGGLGLQRRRCERRSSNQCGDIYFARRQGQGAFFSS